MLIGKGKPESGVSSRRRVFGALSASYGGRAWLPSPRQPCRDSIFFLDSGMVGAKEIA